MLRSSRQHTPCKKKTNGKVFALFVLLYKEGTGGGRTRGVTIQLPSTYISVFHQMSKYTKFSLKDLSLEET